ncbi:MAG: sulfatase-like hydrolase/transferase [Coraliomargaritaceae bacterium]
MKNEPIQTALFAIILCTTSLFADMQKPNVILIMADDISAREFPFYESSVWTDERRAKTPQMNQLAEEGCFIETMWAATICKPSRVSMLNGTYSYQNKYWDNAHIGQDCNNIYSAYESAPITLGNMSRDAGYANIWVSKTHVTGGGDLLSMGFNEHVLNPGEPMRHSGWNQFGTPEENPYPRFISNDEKDWDHDSFFWWPEMQLINHPDFPNEPFKFIPTKINDYAPDLEMEYIFDFIDRANDSNKPFFIFHAPHLGHLAKDYAIPENPTVWPGTPVIEWKNGKYKRKKPKHIRQSDGTYERKNITPDGLSYHVEYLDYQLWQYVEKLKEIGQLENTVIIFLADNATQAYGRWGKGIFKSQQGQHVPMLIYGPDHLIRVQGRQNIVSDITDILPTLADWMGFTFPKGYEKLDGKSLAPYLNNESQTHREWIYSMRMDAQMIRNDKVMRDGYGVWYDVNKRCGDFDSFTKLNDLPNGEYKDTLLQEVEKLEPQLAQFNRYNMDSEGPLPPVDSDRDGIADHFEETHGPLNPKEDPDQDGVDNFHEYIHGGNPMDPKSPTLEQLPHPIEVEDAQGQYLALEFSRLEELGPDYWFIIEGSVDGQNWTTDGVIQQHTLRSNYDGTERIIARIAADKHKSDLQQMRLRVIKPKKRNPRKFKNLLK